MKYFYLPAGIALCMALFMGLPSCKVEQKTESTVKDTMDLMYTVLATFPHDMGAFTQGLAIEGGKVYESTGQDNSWIAEVEVGSGKQDKKVVLPAQYFGEGITVLNHKIYQLTWQNHTGFVYQLPTYKKIKEFSVPTEGWGITHDGHQLIMSDGTHQLYFLDTVTLKSVKTVPVTLGKSKVKNLNELEFVKGYIFANQWETDYIYKIDPTSGKVMGRLDLSSLTAEVKRIHPHADVLNGIAYDAKSRAFLVTGKNWPKAYLIRINE